MPNERTVLNNMILCSFTKTMKIFFFILFFAFPLVTWRFASAAQITLAWDPNLESDLSGYRIYFGTSPRTGGDPNVCGLCGYSTMVDVRNVTVFSLADLNPGQTYYISATAYDTSNNESVFSGQVSGIAREKARCDFNNDQQMDILWRHQSTGQNAVWMMNGTTWTRTVSIPGVGDTNWEIVGVRDFNGDGWNDILWRHMTSGQNTVWLMNGTTWRSSVSLPALSDTNWQIVGVGDFNGDGKPDILWRHMTGGQNKVWLMNGTTWGSTVSLPGVADTNWEIGGAGDFNNDGRVDILWRHKTDGRNSLWLMSGTTWSSTVSLPGVADTNWEIIGP
jgi:hypothetical protein